MMAAAASVASSPAIARPNMVSLSRQKGLDFIVSTPITRPLLPFNCLVSKLCTLTIDSKHVYTKPLLSFHTAGRNFPINLGVQCANEVEPKKHALLVASAVDSDAKEDPYGQQLPKSNRPGMSRNEKNPKCLSSSASQRIMLEYFQILKYPLVSELAMREMLKKNTLVFVVDKRADKKNIKAAVKKMFKVQTRKVNTLIMPDGNKKAYIMLAPNYNALEVAKRLKVI